MGLTEKGGRVRSARRTGSDANSSFENRNVAGSAISKNRPHHDGTIMVTYVPLVSLRADVCVRVAPEMGENHCIVSFAKIQPLLTKCDSNSIASIFDIASESEISAFSVGTSPNLGIPEICGIPGFRRG